MLLSILFYLSQYKKTYPVYITQEVRQYPKRSCKQSTFVNTQTHSEQIDPFSVLWRFPEYDPLEDCELFDFYVVLITVVLYLHLSILVERS